MPQLFPCEKAVTISTASRNAPFLIYDYCLAVPRKKLVTPFGRAPWRSAVPIAGFAAGAGLRQLLLALSRWGTGCFRFIIAVILFRLLYLQRC